MSFPIQNQIFIQHCFSQKPAFSIFRFIVFKIEFTEIAQLLRIFLRCIGASHALQTFYKSIKIMFLEHDDNVTALICRLLFFSLKKKLLFINAHLCNKNSLSTDNCTIIIIASLVLINIWKIKVSQHESYFFIWKSTKLQVHYFCFVLISFRPQKNPLEILCKYLLNQYVM